MDWGLMARGRMAVDAVMLLFSIAAQMTGRFVHHRLQVAKRSSVILSEGPTGERLAETGTAAAVSGLHVRCMYSSRPRKSSGAPSQSAATLRTSVTFPPDPSVSALLVNPPVC